MKFNNKNIMLIGLQGERGPTGAKLVKMELQGQDENGGNVYLMTFDDGTTATFVAPKGEAGEGGGDLDIQTPEGTSIVEDVDGKKVAKLPIAGASSSKKGVLWVGYCTNGLYIVGSGELRVYGAEPSWVALRKTDANALNRPLVTKHMDYYVMEALTNPLTHEWTDEQKALAQATLGLDNKLDKPTTPTAGSALLTIAKNTGKPSIKYFEETNATRTQWFPQYQPPSYGSSQPTGDGRLLSQDPLLPYHTANKKYVDEQLANVSGGTQLYKHELIMGRTTEGEFEYYYKIVITLPTSQVFESFYSLMSFLEENGLQSLFRMYYVRNGESFDKAYCNLISGGYHTNNDAFPHCTKIEDGATSIFSLQGFITSWYTFEEYTPIPL